MKRTFGKRSLKTSALCDLTDEDESSQNDSEDDYEGSIAVLKRLRCETPPVEPDDVIDINTTSPPSPARVEENLIAIEEKQRHNLESLEAIQLKILELECELNEWESNCDDQDEDHSDMNCLNSTIPPNIDSEAYGYAACAQETLLFLEREGYSMNDEIYRTLKDKLLYHMIESYSIESDIE